MFAAAQLGLVTVLLSTRQQTPEIAHVLNDCGAVMIIHEAVLADRLPDTRDVPGLKYRIAVDRTGVGPAFSDLADNAALQSHADVDEEDTAMILYTSGTTGRPKGRDAGALQRHSLGDDFRVLPAVNGVRPLDSRGAARRMSPALSPMS